MSHPLVLRQWQHFCPPRMEDVWLERGLPCGTCGDAEQGRTILHRAPPTSETNMDERRVEGRRSDDVTLALLQRDIEQLRMDEQELRKELAELKTDRDKALRWGISVLGAAVITMGGWIWSMVSKKFGV